MILNGKKIRVTRAAFDISLDDMAQALNIDADRLRDIERNDLIVRTSKDFDQVVKQLKTNKDK